MNNVLVVLTTVRRVLTTCLLCLSSGAFAATLEYVSPFGPINVLDYGCVGDNSTDNVVCLNDALSSAPPGSTVLLPVGVYRVSGTVHIPEKVMLVGENQYGSVISSMWGFPADMPVISMTDADGICLWTAIKSIRIEAYNADIGVYSNCVNEAGGVYDVSIFGYKNIGIYFEKTASAGPNHYSLVNLNIHRSLPPDPTDRGIVIDSRAGKAWVIEGITITTNARDNAGFGSVALDIVAAHDIVINSIHFEGWDIGIRLGNTRNVTLFNAHGHNSMNDNGAALHITPSAQFTVVIGLDGGANTGYKVIDDENLGTSITDNRVSIYESE